MKFPAICSLRFAAFMALGLVFNSCNKLKELVSINLPLETAGISFTLPPLEEGTASATDVDVYLNVDSLIKEEAPNMGVDNIKSVKIESCTITVLNATTEDHFGVLTDCSAAVASNVSPNWLTFAAVTGNPDTYATSLALPVKSDVELKDYFNATRFSYRISATSRRATTTELNCKATIKFKAEVSL